MSVTDVTATLPITSTGGATPNIAIASSPQFTGAVYTDGSSGGFAAGVHGGSGSEGFVLQSHTTSAVGIYLDSLPGSGPDVALRVTSGEFTKILMQVDHAGNVQAASALIAAPLINAIQTAAYVPPVYDTSGESLASTLHIVTGSGNTSPVTNSLEVTLTGAAVFSSANSYIILATIQGGTGYAPVATPFSGSTFQIEMVVPGGGLEGFAVSYLCIGT